MGLRGHVAQLARFAYDPAEIAQHLMLVVAVIVTRRERKIRLHATAKILSLARIFEAAQFAAIRMTRMLPGPVSNVIVGLSRSLLSFNHLRIKLGDQHAVLAHRRRSRDVGNVLDQQIAVADFEVVPVVPHGEQVGTTSD